MPPAGGFVKLPALFVVQETHQHEITVICTFKDNVHTPNQFLLMNERILKHVSENKVTEACLLFYINEIAGT